MIYKINGGYCQIDEADKDYLDQFSWHFDNNGYVKTAVYNVEQKRFITLRMHQVLMGRKDGHYVDHIDRDPANNQKSNLRFLTPKENWYNSHAAEFLYQEGRLKNPVFYHRVRLVQ